MPTINKKSRGFFKLSEKEKDKIKKIKREKRYKKVT